jgi:hypothetical protein
MSDETVSSWSIAWICADSTLFDMARALLDDTPRDDPDLPGSVTLCCGRIGLRSVVIVHVPQPSQASAVEDAIQVIATRFKQPRVLITGFTSGLGDDNAKPGDLVIRYPDQDATAERFHKLAGVLLQEVGADGQWLLGDFAADSPRSIDDSITQRPDLVRHQKFQHSHVGTKIHNSDHIGLGNATDITGLDTGIYAQPLRPR